MTPGYLLLSTVGVLAGLCLLVGSLPASPNRAGGRRHGRGRRRPRRRALAPTLTEFLQDLMAAIRRLEASNEQLRTVTQHHEQLVSKLTVLEATAAHLLDDMTRPLGESTERRSSSEAQVAAPAGAHSSTPSGEPEESNEGPGCQSDRPESPAAYPQRSTWPPLGQPAPHTVHAQQPRHGVATPLPRVLAITAGAVCVALMIGIVLFGDSGAISVQPRRAPSAPGPVQQAEALATLGDYEEAATLYRQALEAAPNDVSLWYALGVVLSRLNQWKDTEEAFHYVVRYGEPDAGEVKVARQWLVHRGVLAPSVPFTAGPPPSEPAASTGVLQVKATWGDLGPNAPSVRLRILLHGLSRAATGQRFSRRIALGQLQRFENLPSGTYRLIGRLEGGTVLWDQTIDVTKGNELTLHLSKDTSQNPTATPVQ